MTDEQLTAIEQRANAATPGPWRVIHEDDEMCMNLYAVAHADVDVDTETLDLTNVICANLVQVPKTINHRDSLYVNWWNDVDFIAGARTDVPALIDEVRRLQAEIDKHKQWEQMAVDHFGDVESAGMAAHSEALTLFESMKAQHYPDSEATPSQTTAGVVLQISNMAAGLYDENKHLRGALMQIANRPEAEMMTARTLHYDMRGWALRALGVESVSRVSISVDARFAGLGREIMQWILDHDDWWQDELSEDIMPLVKQWGLAERVPYSVDQHGEGIDADEGDEIWWVDPKMWSMLPTEITRLRADIERIGHERDQMVAANVELQERLSKLEDDGK